jgi:hypothetical protein
MDEDEELLTNIVRSVATALAAGYNEGVKAERDRVKGILDYQAWLEQSWPGLNTIADIREKVEGGE